MSICLSDEIFTDPCVLSLTLPQRARWYELCRLAARQRRRGVIPPIPGAGLARALGTYPHILERVLGLLSGLGLVERDEDGSMRVPLLCDAPVGGPPEAPGAMPVIRSLAEPVGIPLDVDGMSESTLYRTFGTTSRRKALALAGATQGAGTANGREARNGRNGHAAPAAVPQNVSQNVPDAQLLERFTPQENVPQDVPGDVPPSRASENIPNVPTFSGERENINILSEENVLSSNVPTLNVVPRNVPDVPDGPPAAGNVPPPAAPPPLPRLGGQALIDCNAAVNQVIGYTDDAKSRGWFERLYKACHHTGHPDLWGQALKSTGKAISREHNRLPSDKRGSYFGKTLESLLINAGVPVEVVVSEGRRAEARQAAEELRRRLRADGPEDA